MKYKLHFSVIYNDLDKGELIFLSGSVKELGLWEPKKALKLQKNDKGIHCGTITVEDVEKIEFRYFIGYYLQTDFETNVLLVKKWETHLNPRRILPAIEASDTGEYVDKSPDIFGELVGKNMISDGWLMDCNQHQATICVAGDGIVFFNSKSDKETYRVKFIPLDLRNAPNHVEIKEGKDTASKIILSHSHTEIAPLTKKEPRYRKQKEYGESYTNGADYFLYRTYTISPDQLCFRVEVYEPKGDKPNLLGYGYTIRSTFPNTYGKISIPLLGANHIPIGKIYLGYLFIHPFCLKENKFKMNFTYIKHWKRRNMLEIGHRGMGMTYNSQPNTNCSVARENTLCALNEAAKRGADYVEFDVQLTKDKVPVIFHDFFVLISMTKQAKVKSVEPHIIAVKDLNLNELRLLQLGHVQDVIDAERDQKIVKISGEGDESDELKPFPALADALKHISSDVGFNIEIKYPMVQLDGIHECQHYFEHNEFLDKILRDVFMYAGERRIVFSSFDPDICMMIAVKQNKYPVLFLCCGADTRFQVFEDARTRSSLAAVNFAAGCEILGVNFHSQDILRDPTPIKKAKEFGLISFVWGNELADEASVRILKEDIGVDGIIYDRIGEKQARHNIFLLEKEKRSSLFLKRSPSQQSLKDSEAVVLNAATEGPPRKTRHIDWPMSKFQKEKTSTEFKNLFS